MSLQNFDCKSQLELLESYINALEIQAAALEDKNESLMQENENLRSSINRYTSNSEWKKDD